MNTETVVSFLKNNESLRVLANRLHTNCIKNFRNQQRRDLLLGTCIFIQAVLLCNIFLYYVMSNSKYVCVEV
jgi:hypothetical protein